MSSLQFFSYRFSRIILHYTKPQWHLYFFIFPVVCYFLTITSYPKLFVLIVVFLMVALFLWQKTLDKRLVFTYRVKSFFTILLLVTAFIDILILSKIGQSAVLPLFLPLMVTFFISYSFEKYRLALFKKKALSKLNSMPNLKIIEITASFGKTSIKNYIYEILKDDFKVYKTPRSVNTLNGLIKDINEELTFDREIYIAEAGARQRGDIAEITHFLRPHIVVVGEIGKQHIEYFKTIQNIRQTKLEALLSPRLKKAFLHSTTEKSDADFYDKKLLDVSSTLDGLSFKFRDGEQIYEFESPLLGKFNAYNLAVAIEVARYLGVDMQEIEKRLKKLTNPSHRLEKIESGGKIIIDDSFNGNLSGMVASYELVSTFAGRKVIVTPGIVEATIEQNRALIKKIDEVFDLVIVTGELNRELFKSLITKELIVLHDKKELVDTLAKKTKSGDLIIFSNDAPTYI